MSLSTIRARLDAASPGEWLCIQEGSAVPYLSVGGTRTGRWQDYDIAANAPTDLALLLEVAVAAEELVRKAEEIDPAKGFTATNIVARGEIQRIKMALAAVERA